MVTKLRMKSSEWGALVLVIDVSMTISSNSKFVQK